MIWFVVVSGIFNIIMALIMNTKNLSSAMLFKVIPFFLGAGCILFSLKHFNII